MRLVLFFDRAKVIFMFCRPAILLFLGAIWLSCAERQDSLFRDLPSSKTGVNFRNTLRETEAFNVLTYTYFYNGGGVAIGDMDNDGLADIYFTGNLVASHLYHNKGNWKFDNIAEAAGVRAEGLWNTGVTMADVNGDGWLDIYICRSAAADPDARKNLLFINNQDLTFTEQGEAFGLDDPAYSTQAAFFDYDRDGDLDLYLLNHSVPEFANFDGKTGTLKDRSSPYYGDKLYRNEGNGRFADVSAEAGIITNVLGFGLGVAISDYNNDHWPDIYVSNDFNEEDYLYLNNQDGSFRQSLQNRINHVSLFSMGSDAADVNNDGATDLLTLDMLPKDNYRNKLTSGPDNYDKYRLLIEQGFHQQSMRNMLQLNEGNGHFAEIGQLSGISNSDWSWSALFADYDLDGWQDLFITNGYLRDYTNMDFLSYTVDLKMKSQREGKQPKTEDILKEMPRIDVPNQIYKNIDGTRFEEKTESWGFSEKLLSNGAAFGDLDNDGDLDLVVNNVNELARMYRNEAIQKGSGNYLKVRLRSDQPNGFAIGAKVRLHFGQSVLQRELYPSRGFQSAVEPVIHFGLPSTITAADSIIVYWPEGEAEHFSVSTLNSDLTLVKGSGRPAAAAPMVNKTIFQSKQLVSFRHRENNFNDFKRQGLLPRLYSRDGPPLTTADVNGDGLPDLICGGANGQPTMLYLGDGHGEYAPKPQFAFSTDSRYEDVAIKAIDLEGDGDTDLAIASGGNAFPAGDEHYTFRIYENDGEGNFTRYLKIPEVRTNAHCLAIADWDADGDPDIFIGSGYRPGQYPLPDENALLLNDGKAGFTIMDKFPFKTTRVMASEASDFDQDGQTELLLAGEWEPISIWSWSGTNWQLEHRTREHGWWTALHVANLDEDAQLEIIAGNFGHNSQFRASELHPVVLYYGDFDQNGALDPVLTSYLGDKSYPFVSRDDLLSQLPQLKKQYPNYDAYAKTDTDALLPYLPGFKTDTVHTLSSILLDPQPQGLISSNLPTAAQFSPVFAIQSIDYDQDGDQDLLLTGNSTHNRVKIGEIDANHGQLLENRGQLQFRRISNTESGLFLKGNSRSILLIKNQQHLQLLFGINDAPVQGYELHHPSLLQ